MFSEALHPKSEHLWKREPKTKRELGRFLFAVQAKSLLNQASGALPPKPKEQINVSFE
jgi:hypothetical protein